MKKLIQIIISGLLCCFFIIACDNDDEDIQREEMYDLTRNAGLDSTAIVLNIDGVESALNKQPEIISDQGGIMIKCKNDSVDFELFWFPSLLPINQFAIKLDTTIVSSVKCSSPTIGYLDQSWFIDANGYSESTGRIAISEFSTVEKEMLPRDVSLKGSFHLKVFSNNKMRDIKGSFYLDCPLITYQSL